MPTLQNLTLPLLALIALPCTALAQTPALTFKNKPVSPLCLELLNEDTKKVNMTSCTKAMGVSIKSEGEEDGFLTTRFTYPDESGEAKKESGMPDPYDSTTGYKVLGATPDGIAVLSHTEGGGGSGRFSNLRILEIDGNMLIQKKAITGGDRCNGGIIDAAIKDGQLNYSVYATPGDLPALAWGGDRGITAYEDLEASAASCFAKVEFKNDTIQNVTLLKDALANEPSAEWVKNYKLQSCFNELFHEKTKAGDSPLPLNDFKTFMDGFFAKCAAPKK